MNITIIAPNGYKLYMTLKKEVVEQWGNELITLAHFDISGIAFDFSDEGKWRHISET